MAVYELNVTPAALKLRLAIMGLRSRYRRADPLAAVGGERAGVRAGELFPQGAEPTKD